MVSGNCTFQRGDECISSPVDLTNTDDSIPLIKYMLRWGEPTISTSTLRTDFVGKTPPLNGLYDTGQDHDPGLINIDQDTGQIVAVPVATGTYTMWFIAYVADPDSEFGEQFDRGNIPPQHDQVVLEVWEFEVVEQQDFQLQDAAKGLELIGTDVGLDSDDVVKEKVQYEKGSTITFPKMDLTNEAMFLTPANNDFAKITYKRKFNESSSADFDSPGLWLVDTETGEMLAQPEHVGNYTVQLLAVDGSGAEVEVRSWSFEVVEAEVFQVNDWEWEPVENPNAYVYRSQTDANETGTKIYGVGDTYQFAKIGILGSLNPTGGAITFTMDGAPDGFLIDPKTGYIKGTPTTANSNQTMQIYAVDTNTIANHSIRCA